MYYTICRIHVLVAKSPGDKRHRCVISKKSQHDVSSLFPLGIRCVNFVIHHSQRIKNQVHHALNGLAPVDRLRLDIVPLKYHMDHVLGCTDAVRSRGLKMTPHTEICRSLSCPV